jgi:hypothetical protein
VEVKGWKRQLRKQIAAEHRRAAREHLHKLREQVKHARLHRRDALGEAKARCKRDRLELRVKLKAKRAAIMQKLRDIAARQRKLAHETCSGSLASARRIKDDVERARAELKAERVYRAELRAIAKANRESMASHKKATRSERRAESDDEVRSNIPESYLALWGRVKGGIKASPRRSRTEAFMQYAEENPDELLESLGDVTDKMVRQHEAAERAAAKRFRAGPPAYAPTPF